MLRNALDDLRMVMDQVPVAFGRCILDSREKKMGIVPEPLKNYGHEPILGAGDILLNPIKVFPAYLMEDTGFDAFQCEQAGFPAHKAIDGSHRLTFEEKLGGDILPVLVEPHTQTTLLHKK